MTRLRKILAQTDTIGNCVACDLADVFHSIQHLLDARIIGTKVSKVAQRWTTTQAWRVEGHEIRFTIADYS